MNLNVSKSIIDKYLSTLELNEQIASFYNEYFSSFNDYKPSNISIYEYILDCLEVDKFDDEFNAFSKRYNIKRINELDKLKYINNEYNKNIKIDQNIKYKNYKLNYDYYDDYSLFISDEIEVDSKDYFKETYQVSYFKSKYKFLSLSKDNTTWMSIIPHEINTMEEDINKVKGNVLVLGLGLGYFLYRISNKLNVKEITVLEMDEDIINIFNKFIYPHFKYKDKIKIIKYDGLKYLNDNNLSKYNYVYTDLYHNANDGLFFYTTIKKIEKRLENTMFLYWIEKNIICLIRRLLLELIEESYYLKNKHNDNNHLKNIDHIDYVFNKLYFLTKNLQLNNKEDIDNLLSDENIKELIKNI